MKCSRQSLSEYLDGELSSSDRQALQQHLFVCGECREVLAEYARISEQIRSLPRHPLPRTFGVDLRTALERRHSAHEPFPAMVLHLRPAVLATAATLLLAFALFGVYFGVFRSLRTEIRPSEWPGLQVDWMRQRDDTRVPVDLVSTAPSPDPLEIRFGQAMDRVSVERSTHIEPPVAVEYFWADDALIVFPTEHLDAGTSYTVTIFEARNARGESIDQPIVIRFRIGERTIRLLRGQR
ncbi:MAG: zf-HC2 domain-containing protein [Chloroflexi bacterium]|nr:zf-HC2 domain-containing protein [Chloroflexota bacterium]